MAAGKRVDQIFSPEYSSEKRIQSYSSLRATRNPSFPEFLWSNDRVENSRVAVLFQESYFALFVNLGDPEF